MSVVRRAEASLIPFKLDRPVGGSGVGLVDVIVVELEDADGASGLGFSYVLGGGGGLALMAVRDQLARFVTGRPAIAPRALWKNIQRTFNRSGFGPNLIGLAALDTATWDLHARRAGVPLGVAMGGEPHSVPVYGSGGFNTDQSDAEAADVASAHLARGLRGVKPRVAGVPKDAKVLTAVRHAVGDAVHVMTDANEKCDLASAQWLLTLARDVGVLFVEEPLPSQAVSGYRLLKETTNVPIALGEHMQDSAQLVALMAERTASVIQPDLAMIGGLTPVLDLAMIAEALDVTVSPHFLHGLFAHVAAASSSLRWLEEFPLLEPLFDGWPKIGSEGTVSAAESPGHGLSLSDRALSLLARKTP
jgi:L-alanine-DL-glutamate epimerase-like enolase superfamily enzyme